MPVITVVSKVYPKDISRRFKELKQVRQDIIFPEIPWERNWFTPK